MHIIVFLTSNTDLFPVLVSKDLPSGEDDGSTPWPPISERTSKGSENVVKPASLCQRFVCVTQPLRTPPYVIPLTACSECGFVLDFFNLCLNDDTLTSCCTLSLPLLASLPKSGHNTRLQLCRWDVNISTCLLSFSLAAELTAQWDTWKHDEQ